MGVTPTEETSDLGAPGGVRGGGGCGVEPSPWYTLERFSSGGTNAHAAPEGQIISRNPPLRQELAWPE